MLYRYWNIWYRTTNKIKAFGLLVCLLLCFGVAMGQRGLQNSYNAFAQYGMVLPTNDFVRGNNTDEKPIDRCLALSLRYTFHTAGEYSWHSLYNFPTYGIGIFSAEFNLPDQLGSPIALYGFYSNEFFKLGKWRLLGDYGLGIATNWRHFTPEHNHNDAISSVVTCYADATFVFKREITPNLDLGFGVSLTHFSNGAMVKPNKGLNLLSTKISADYKPKALKPRTVSASPVFNPHFFGTISVFAGQHCDYTRFDIAVADDTYKQRYFKVFGLDLRLFRRFTQKHSLGLGIGAGYDQYVNDQYKVNGRQVEFEQFDNKDKFNLTAYLSYEYRIHRLGLLIEPGVLLYKYEKYDVPPFFQRVGLRYNLNNNLVFGVNLRAIDFTIAQYIEFNIGYNIPFSKNKD